jgi:hypothetical protein
MNRLVTLSDGDSRAFVYPEQGFQLHGFDVGTTQVVYGPRGAREPADRRYGNPVLFPSVGLTTGSRPHHWDHQGQSLLMQQHGWARDLYWHVVENDASSITAVLTPTSGVRVSFPFDFELRLRYAVKGASLVLDTTINNTGKEALPYALGFHPYLKAPLAGRREACSVALPKGVRLQTTDNWKTATKTEFAARSVAANDAELPGSIVLAETGARAMEVVDEVGRAGGADLRRGQRRNIPLLGGVERGARRPVRLPGAVDGLSQRAHPPRRAHAGRGGDPEVPDDDLAAVAVARPHLSASFNSFASRAPASAIRCAEIARASRP